MGRSGRWGEIGSGNKWLIWIATKSWHKIWGQVAKRRPSVIMTTFYLLGQRRILTIRDEVCQVHWQEHWAHAAEIWPCTWPAVGQSSHPAIRVSSSVECWGCTWLAGFKFRLHHSLNRQFEQVPFYLLAPMLSSVRGSLMVKWGGYINIWPFAQCQVHEASDTVAACSRNPHLFPLCFL
jgi:hypothetical protein